MGQGGSKDDADSHPTSPPPFDPEQYARDSEAALRKPGPDLPSTQKLLSAPPLDKRVRLNVSLTELAWFDLSEAAVRLAQGIDGSKTILELMEGSPSEAMLAAVAQLHDAGLLEYER